MIAEAGYKGRLRSTVVASRKVVGRRSALPIAFATAVALVLAADAGAPRGHEEIRRGYVQMLTDVYDLADSTGAHERDRRSGRLQWDESSELGTARAISPYSTMAFVDVSQLPDEAVDALSSAVSGLHTRTMQNDDVMAAARNRMVELSTTRLERAKLDVTVLQSWRRLSVIANNIDPALGDLLDKASAPTAVAANHDLLAWLMGLAFVTCEPERASGCAGITDRGYTTVPGLAQILGIMNSVAASASPHLAGSEEVSDG